VVDVRSQDLAFTDHTPRLRNERDYRLPEGDVPISVSHGK
jgi:hypothetical protein